MSERLIPFAFLAIVLIPIGIFVWQIWRVRKGLLSKRRGILLFFVYSIPPVTFYVLVFFALLGAEGVTELAIISEGYGRTFIIVVGIGTAVVLLMTVAFALVVALSKPRGK